jgi:hypothetical protein
MNAPTFRLKLDELIAAGDADEVDALVSEFLDSERGTLSDRMHHVDLAKSAYLLKGGFGAISEDPRERAVQQLYETAARYL